jgi:hypothetical protein
MNIKEAIKTLAETGANYGIVGTVSDMDRAAYTCTVTPRNGDAAVLGVRVQAANRNGFLLWPTEGSDVIVEWINEHTGYVAMCSEVDEVEIIIEEVKVVINKDGLLVDKAGNGLSKNLASILELMLKILTTMESFKVVTPSGISTAVAPDSLVLLQQHKQEAGTITEKIKDLLP